MARQLWDAGIRADFFAKVKPKLLPQFKASENGPLTVILGQDELAVGQVRLKVAQQASHQETDEGDGKSEKDRGQLVSRDNLVEEVRKLLDVVVIKQE